MASPVVEATNTSVNDTDVTAHTVNLPASVAAGNILIIAFSYDFSSGGAVTTPAGWQLKTSGDIVAGADTLGLAIFSCVAHGAEGSTLTVTTAAVCRSVHQSYRISGGMDVEAAIAEATGVAADPPNIAPSWGSSDFLCLVVAAVADESSALSALPTNYTNSLANQSTFNDLASGRRALTAASSENPAAFSFTAGGFAWLAATIAIKPGTSVIPIGFRSISAAVAVASGDLTLTEPTGAALGDLLIADIAYRSNVAFALPSGWTLVATQQSSGNTSTTPSAAIGSGLMAYIIRGASAPALVFTRTAGDVALGRIRAYVNVHQTTPLIAGTSETAAASSVTGTCPEVTTDVDNALTVMAACGGSDTTFSAHRATSPAQSAWGERADSLSTLGGDTSLSVADSIKTTAGATGAFLFTAAVASRHVCIAGAFRPAGDATIAATGTPTSQAATVAGVVSSTISVTGTLAAQAATIAGTAIHITTDGALASQSSIITGVAEAKVNATGALTSQSSVISGIAEPVIEVSGDLSSQAAIVSGIVESIIEVSGALTSQPATIVGSAEAVISVDGSLQASNASIASIAEAIIDVNGVLQAVPSIIAGVFTAESNEISVVGALTAQPASIAGAVGIIVTFNGILSAQPAFTAGAATVILPLAFIGTLAAQNASISGTFTVIPLARREKPDMGVSRHFWEQHRWDFKVGRRG